jgi:hypothetical protein
MATGQMRTKAERSVLALDSKECQNLSSEIFRTHMSNINGLHKPIAKSVENSDINVPTAAS